MATENEIKQVINIDSGNSRTILKEMIKLIDDLRASLEGLDVTSEEYKQRVGAIEDAQDKLNSILNASSNKINDVDGDYEKLVDTLQDLEDQMNQVNQAGGRLNVDDKISDLSDKIRDLASDTSNSTTEISNFGSKGVETFANMMSQADSFKDGVEIVNGNLNTTIRTIAQCGKAAMTAGTQAAAAEALATGGLTLLISAFTLVITYWEDISAWMDKGYAQLEKLLGLQSSYTDEVGNSERAIEQMNNRLAEAGSQLDFNLKMMQAQGASEVEIAQARLKGLRQQLEETKNANIEYAKSHHGWTTLEASDAEDNLRKQVKQAEQELQISQAKEKHLAEIRENAAKDSLKTTHTSNTNIRKENKEHIDADEAQRQKQAEQILNRLDENNKTELEKLEDKYNKEKKILEAAGKDVTKLTEEYEANVTKLLQKQDEERQKIMTDQFKSESDKLKEQQGQKTFELSLVTFDGTEIEQERAKLDAMWQIDKEYYDNLIAKQEEYLACFIGSAEDRKKAEDDLNRTRQEYSNKEMKYNADVVQNTKKAEEQKKKDRNAALSASLSVASDIMGQLSELAEEGSTEQKMLSVMAATISTFEAAVNAYKHGAGIGGPVLGAAMAAAATLAGVAQVQKIMQTNKENAGTMINGASGGNQMQGLSMTQVSPLLNEEMDTQRLTTLTELGDSTTQTQNLRVYVVDQDIRDANNRAQVVQNNTTF